MRKIGVMGNRLTHKATGIALINIKDTDKYEIGVLYDDDNDFAVVRSLFGDCISTYSKEQALHCIQSCYSGLSIIREVTVSHYNNIMTKEQACNIIMGKE